MSREDGEAEQEDVDGDDEGSGAFTPKVDELENLLEAYFVQLDRWLPIMD
jgi:magnesium transporter